ncbi:MAG: calcium-binding protein [Desulfovibrionaceae bacterium]
MKADLYGLLRELSEDENARAELARAGSPDELAAVAARLASARGYDVTPEALTRAIAPPEGELSDAELHTMVGGKGSIDQKLSGDQSVWAFFAYLLDFESGAVFNDTLDGGDGNDTIWGGFGEDSMLGGDGNDIMDGDDGNDTMYGEEGADYMTGGDGDDFMDGGSRNDSLFGQEGDDIMDGGAGNDFVSGGRGDDIMDGGDGNDTMDGGEGDDSMDGGAGNDNLDGGDGVDTLDGGAGNDILTGGNDRDVFVFGTDSGRDVITDFIVGYDKLRFEGAESIDDIHVANSDGDTVITYGNTTIVVQGWELTAKEVWNNRG